MDRMNIVAGVAHPQSIPFSLLQMECGWCWFPCHWIRHAIDRPSVEAFFSGVGLRECHIECFVRRRSSRAGPRETCVVPLERRRSNPLRLSAPARVLHYDTHSVAAVIVREITENPGPRMGHVYDGRDALGCANP